MKLIVNSRKKTHGLKQRRNLEDQQHKLESVLSRYKEELTKLLQDRDNILRRMTKLQAKKNSLMTNDSAINQIKKWWINQNEAEEKGNLKECDEEIASIRKEISEINERITAIETQLVNLLD